VLTFLFQARSLYVLENAWIEPTVLGLFGLSLVLWERGRTSLGAAFAGFTFGLKHYLAFIIPQYLIIERSVRAWLILCAAGAIAFIPFLIVDAKSLWENGLWLVVSLPFSDSALVVASAVHRATGYVPGPLLSITMGAVFATAIPIALLRVPPLPRYLLASTTTLYATFLFGAKAFCNYYYLVSGMLVLALALHAGKRAPDESAKTLRA
jgi:hypothetical protein